MRTIYTYFKNSNTNDLIERQKFIETRIIFPTNYYRNRQRINTPDLTGYVIISEKKYDRLIRKQT